MKKIIFGIVAFASIACSDKERKELSNQSTFTVTIKDTLIVDPGGEILYLQHNLSQSQVDKNGRYLYNFNQSDNSLDVVDLDQLKLDKKIRFEKEGPHGTGGYIQSMYYGGENNILLSEYHQISLFDSRGLKKQTHKILQQKFVGDTLLPNETLSANGLVDDAVEYFITLYSQGFGEPLGIAKVRLNDYHLTKIAVPALQDLAKFRVVLSAGGGTSAAHPSTYMINSGGKLLFSNRAVNEVLIFDLKNDAVKHYRFQSSLTPDSQKDNLRINVNSEAEFHKTVAERGKDVSFAPFVYDTVNERYYRLTQDFVEEGPEGNSYRPVLTIFDRNFNQIFETDQLPVKKMFWRYFAKDGKLYLFENIRDELAFIVMEMED